MPNHYARGRTFVVPPEKCPSDKRNNKINIKFKLWRAHVRRTTVLGAIVRMSEDVCILDAAIFKIKM